MSGPESLRERKKAATRAALSAAAVRIARESGIENVTAEAVAAAAGVSTRTFHNYFASKEEAVLHHMHVALERLVEYASELPSDVPVWDSLEQAFIDALAGVGIDDLVIAIRLAASHPVLKARNIEQFENTLIALGRSVAARTGTNYDTDLYPRMIHLAAMTASRAAIELWADGARPDATPAELMHEAFALARAGLPEPTGPPVHSHK